MSDWADLLLVLVVLLDLWVVATSRLRRCIHGVALQGAALALLPLALWGSSGHFSELLLLSVGTFVIKAVLIPLLLLRAVRAVRVQREVEPFASLHVSLLVAAALVGLAFWLAGRLPLPRAAPAKLLVPAALATLFLGFLVLIARRKAITQVVGYLMLENGVFVFGQVLGGEVPFAVELGVLLDVVVGVFVMGITIHHISREFNSIDADALVALKD